MRDTTFLGVWPVLDETATVDELAAEADDELVRLAWAQGAVVVGDREWTVAEGTVIGYPSPTGLYLMCTAPAKVREDRSAPRVVA